MMRWIWIAGNSKISGERSPTPKSTRRIRDNPEEGYAYLEEVMKDAAPGLGYSMPAQIETKSQHNMVITTNFDNLVADALLIYTDVRLTTRV